MYQLFWKNESIYMNLHFVLLEYQTNPTSSRHFITAPQIVRPSVSTTYCNVSSMRFLHSVSFLSLEKQGKAKKCITPRYKSTTFLGDQFWTTKSCIFTIPAALINCFTKDFIFYNFCFPPFMCITYFVLIIL